MRRKEEREKERRCEAGRRCEGGREVVRCPVLRQKVR